MSVSTLATVEQQLIMHFLQSREIVQLALCSRSLMHAADSPFAFRHAETIRRPFPERPQSSAIVSPARSQLSRHHVPFVVIWTLPETDSAAELAAAVNALIAFLDSAPAGRLHGLDAEDSAAWITESQWKRILACPAVQQIRVLALPRPRKRHHAVSAGLVELLSHLPLLSTLRIGDSDHCGAKDSCALLKLSEFPSLTSFDSSAYYHTWPPICLRSLAGCRQLTSLGFSAGNLGHNGPDVLSCLKGSPVLLSLVHLRVQWMDFSEEYLEPFFRVISRMSQLRQITFAFCGDLQLVYAQLPSIASRHPLPATLETICIQPALGSSDYQELPLLAQMLAALPRLRLVLLLEAHFVNKAHPVSIATSLHRLYSEGPELAEVRAAGRFSIDWRMPAMAPVDPAPTGIAQ